VSLAKAYVREMMDLNPMFDAATIMRRRRELWGVAVGLSDSGAGAAVKQMPASDPEADARLRDRARQCLDVLQSQFYELPKEKLNQYLGVLESDRLPEYAATATRLRAAADCRDVLINALAETGDPKFTYSLQHSVVSPPAKSGAVREQYIEAIIAERRVTPAIQMVHRFAIAHPDVRELQRDWFDVLLDPENRKVWQSQYSLSNRARAAIGSGVISWGAIGFVVLFALVRGIIALSDGKPDRPVPTYNQNVRVAPFPGVPPNASWAPGVASGSDPAERNSLIQQRMQEILGEQTERTESNRRDRASEFERVNVLPNDPLMEMHRRHREIMDRIERTRPPMTPGFPGPGERPPDVESRLYSPPNVPHPNFSPPSFPANFPANFPGGMPSGAPSGMPGGGGFP